MYLHVCLGFLRRPFSRLSKESGLSVQIYSIFF